MAEAPGGAGGEEGQPVKVTGWPTLELDKDKHPWSQKGDWLPTSVRFCHWAAPQTTGLGEKILKGVLAAASFALLIANTVQAMRIADLRHEIAKSYADLARERWDRFANFYKPLEARIIQMLMEDPEVEPEYAEALGIYTDCATDPYWRDDYGRLSRMYALCPDRAVTRSMEAAAALRLDDLVNLGYRDAEDVAHLRDVDRWNRRGMFLNTGRDVMTLSVEAARTGDAILENGMNAATQGAGEAIGFLSYLRESRETVNAGLGILMPATPNSSALMGG